MKVIELLAENVKKLKAVEIHPDGAVVQITGRNGQGKTSVLDCLWLALRAADTGIEQPIRAGETKARIRLELGDKETEVIVERRFTEGGSQLIVSNPEGVRFKSPQEMLNALIGALAFDPLEFVQMDRRKQYDALRTLADIPADIDKLDGLNRADFATRTDVNREAAKLRARAEGLIIPKVAVHEEATEDELIAMIGDIGKHNAVIAEAEEKRASANRELARLSDKVRDHMKEAERLRALADAEEKKADEALRLARELKAGIDALPTPPLPRSVAELQERLANARALATVRKKHEEREEIIAEAKAKEAEAERLTARMKAREEEKAEAIAAANFPIPGLGFGAECVTYNGTPLEQASTAEQLRVSIAIAMAKNPKLKVIRMQHGNDLDRDSMRLLDEMATKHGYQVWLERVDDSGKVGIVIEDGEVVAIDGKAPPPKPKPAPKLVQKGNTAGGDIIGGNKVTTAKPAQLPLPAEREDGAPF